MEDREDWGPLDRVARRTNDCWLGDIRRPRARVHVCGHRFLLPLEGTGLEIWLLLDGTLTVAQIAETLAARYPGGNRARILEDTAAFVHKLELLGLAAWRNRPLFEDVSLDA